MRAAWSVRRWQAAAIALAVVLAYLVLRRHIVSAQLLVFFVALVPSIIAHEVSHGVVALWLGDDTAKRAGRLTANPVRHIDPFGSLILPAVLLLAGLPAFGYARPVPVNLSRLRHPRNGSLLVALAGPLTNFLLAALAAVAIRFGVPNGPRWAIEILAALGEVNVYLGVFNLIPIPPLDGSAVLERLLPVRWWPGYLRIRPYALVAVLAVVLLRPTALDSVFTPAVQWWTRLAA